MKAILATAFAFATFAAPVAADDAPPVDASDPNDNLEVVQYNIWFCSAVRRGYQGYGAQFYFGASQPFPAGSGFGQQARYSAQWQALNQCGGNYYCVSDCYVHRFQLN